jgi:hypothetical protein
MTEKMNGVPRENIETFDTGAFREKADYRYDLMSPIVAKQLIDNHYASIFAAYLLTEGQHMHSCTLGLKNVLGCNESDIAHLYAQALHEGATKYGERNWEKGIPESNLINHALYHLFKLVSGDESENHRSHLVWNVLTLVHFREHNKTNP